MQLTRLGDTNLTVSKLGLGLAALGRPGYINIGHANDLGTDYDVSTMETRAHRVLDTAWASGVRYLDTARSYGRGEAFLASWLASRKIAPGAVTVGSKWGYTYTARWSTVAEKHEVKTHTLDTLLRQTAESRTLLGDQLDLYQIHSASLDSGVLERAEVLTELANLKASGLAIGLSLTGTGQGDTLRCAIGVMIDGQRLFDAVQATWNLLETSAGPALADARAAGLGVIIKEGLANGRLTPRNDDPAFASQRQHLRQTASRLGTTIDALALAAVLARPWADVVLSGASTENHLRSNLAALNLEWSPEIDATLADLSEPSDMYWSTRAGLSWN